MKIKIVKIDEEIQKLLEKYLFHIAVGLLILISILIRYNLAPITYFSADYRSHLVHWITAYRNLGIAEGLSQNVGNYYVPYNVLLAIIAQLPTEPWVLITLTSCIFDYIIAFFVYRLANLLYGGGAKESNNNWNLSFIFTGNDNEQRPLETM